MKTRTILFLKKQGEYIYEVAEIPEDVENPTVREKNYKFDFIEIKNFIQKGQLRKCIGRPQTGRNICSVYLWQRPMSIPKRQPN